MHTRNALFVTSPAWSTELAVIGAVCGYITGSHPKNLNDLMEATRLALLRLLPKGLRFRDLACDEDERGRARILFTLSAHQFAVEYVLECGPGGAACRWANPPDAPTSTAPAPASVLQPGDRVRVGWRAELGTVSDGYVTQVLAHESNDCIMVVLTDCDRPVGHYASDLTILWDATLEAVAPGWTWKRGNALSPDHHPWGAVLIADDVPVAWSYQYAHGFPYSHESSDAVRALVRRRNAAEGAAPRYVVGIDPGGKDGTGIAVVKVGPEGVCAGQMVNVRIDADGRMTAHAADNGGRLPITADTSGLADARERASAAVEAFVDESSIVTAWTPTPAQVEDLCGPGFADTTDIRAALAREELQAAGIDTTHHATGDLVAHYDRVIAPREAESMERSQRARAIRVEHEAREAAQVRECERAPVRPPGVGPMRVDESAVASLPVAETLARLDPDGTQGARFDGRMAELVGAAEYVSGKAGR